MFRQTESQSQSSFNGSACADELTTVVIVLFHLRQDRDDSTLAVSRRGLANFS